MKKMLLISILTSFWTSALFADGTLPPGSGTLGAPYQVSTLDHLLWISTNSSSWSSYFEQIADIDASTTSGWNSGAGFYPIGDVSTNFTGSYDGQNHTISGLTINRSGTDLIGLFGHTTTGANINNLGVTNVVVSGHNHTGALVGNNYGATISNCYSTGSVSGYRYVGGLVGWNEASTVNNSYSTCSANGYGYVGGLVGKNTTSSTVSNCYATGSVSISGTSYVGGLIAHSYITNPVTNCYSTGSVTGGSQYIGGLIGANYLTTVTDSFWDTETSNQAFSGGGTGKTTSEMKTLATFTDVTTDGLTTAWDFETNPNDDSSNNDYWDMDLGGTINSGYPFLSWQNGGEVSLSVELISFSAYQESRSIKLEWITESEVENLGFILERKTDNTAWQQIASYQTHTALQGQGNTSTRTEYTYTDSDVEPGSSYYYRLSDVNTSGDITTLPPLFMQLDALPEETSMEKAYPNPFNPYTYISYHLSEDTDVMITVFDMLGRSVKTLLNGNQVAGSYQVYWNGADENGIKTSTGNYMIRMQTESMNQIQKVMFIK